MLHKARCIEEEEEKKIRNSSRIMTMTQAQVCARRGISKKSEKNITTTKEYGKKLSYYYYYYFLSFAHNTTHIYTLIPCSPRLYSRAHLKKTFLDAARETRSKRTT